MMQTQNRGHPKENTLKNDNKLINIINWISPEGCLERCKGFNLLSSLSQIESGGRIHLILNGFDAISYLCQQPI